jgi:hydrogenase maturation protease
MAKTLVLGAGNLLLSDEGFGVHFVRHLEKHYPLPPWVELVDAGTLGLMIAHKLEEASRVYIIDTVFAEGAPGKVLRYGRDEIMFRSIPVKLSQHQAGIQEMLLVSELRGRCPQEIMLLGVIPATLQPGCVLSSALVELLDPLARQLAAELQATPLEA